MVKLNKIYTRQGDDGTTGLVGGARVSKASLRVEAYGTVDEANAAIGLCVVEASRVETQGRDDRAISGILRHVQHDLFDLGADLATPVAENEAEGAALRITPGQTDRLEAWIDEWNAHLAPLTSFILPGGTKLGAELHLARTITRRAERLVVHLREEEKHAVSPETVRYLNRLSDLLFVLGRVANGRGTGDVLWEPGKNRG